MPTHMCKPTQTHTYACVMLHLDGSIAIIVATVQLNSNLTLVFDSLQFFTDFIRVPHQCSRVICM